MAQILCWSRWAWCRFTYPGVSCLLKFLSNGLIRGHDNKHLNGHVEDGHGDQVGNIVSVERGGNNAENAQCILLPGRGREHSSSELWSGWGLYVWATPVSFAVVQSAAGPEGLIVILSPANERHRRPECREKPDKHSQSDGTTPLQLGSWQQQEQQRGHLTYHYFINTSKYTCFSSTW